MQVIVKEFASVDRGQFLKTALAKFERGTFRKSVGPTTAELTRVFEVSLEMNSMRANITYSR